MSSKILSYLRRGLLLVPAAACLLVTLPLRAESAADATTEGVPDPGTMTAAPVLNAPAPILRPVPMPDGSFATGNSAPAPAPEPAPVSAPEPAPTPAPAPEPGPITLASAAPLLASASPAEDAATEMGTAAMAVNPPAPDSSLPPTPPSNSAPATGSPNAMVNLVNLLVGQHVITKDAGEALIKQAVVEASNAQAAVAQNGSPAGSNSSGSGDDDTVRVAYVPDVVKNQIRDEVKADVMKQAQDEHWAAVEPAPDWVHRFHVSGDVRIRYEGDFYPDGNATGQLVNFNAINTGSPFNINASPLIPPAYNVDQERNRFRLRARLGAEVDLTSGFTAGLRIGSGADNSPVTENQTLGGVNSFTQNQGGNFSKYAVWIDRAFIKYEGGVGDLSYSMAMGRVDNPFFGTSMVWADDLAFDGFVAKAKYQVADGVTPFATVGAFPVFNTDLNFGTSSTSAGQGYHSEDKWLYAAQLGTNWKIDKDFNLKGAVAYYDFNNIEGKVSDTINQDVFTSVGAGYQGSTDDSRPLFAQHGNTYMALRNVVPGVLPPNTSPDYQYYGLATPFRVVAATAQLDFSRFDPYHLSLTGEFIENIAFDRTAIMNGGPAVARGPQNNNNGSSFQGGNKGYNVRVVVGSPALEKLWDWNVNLTYRYVESDAMVDGFTDSDFGGPLAGTNLQGYIIGANLALSSRVWTGLRWMSSDSIAGPTYKNDLIQFDLNAKF